MNKLNTKVLKDALRERDFEVEYFAARVDQHAPPVSVQTARGWINGTIQPTSLQLCYISGCLGKTEEELTAVTLSPGEKKE